MDWDEQQSEALNLFADGQHTMVVGPAGTGRSSLAVEVARRALENEGNDRYTSVCARDGDFGGAWAPALVLAPDRRRAARLDRWLTDLLGSGATAKLTAPGSHRLVRSLDSYAYLVVGTWLVERTQPHPRPPVMSGAREDVWIAQFLEEEAESWQQTYAKEVLDSSLFRMELRNILARSGQAGLLPSDLEQLAERTEVDTWRLAAQIYRRYAGEDSVAFTSKSPNFDSARLPRIAANLIRSWKDEATAHGVAVGPPIPDVLVIDDLQDFPPSAFPLVDTLAAEGTQVFATFSGIQTVTQFRGGSPQTGVDLARKLSANVVHLEDNYRSAAKVQEVEGEVAAWLPPTALTETRNIAAGQSTLSDDPSPDPPVERSGSVTAELVPSLSKMFAVVEGYLRREHLVNGVAWHDMAVICRSSRDVESLRAALARRGLPLHSSERSVVLAKVPICRALLTLLAEPNDNAEYETGTHQGSSELDEDINQQLLDLLISPLIGADSLQVYRLLRQLRLVEVDPLLGVKDLVEYVGAAEEPQIGGRRVDQRTWRKVRRASRVWNQRIQARTLPAEVGLWHLWNAAGVAETLRSQAREGDGGDALEAGDALDAMLALFRKADLWAQENAGRNVDAVTFASELLSQEIETDTLAPTGVARRGVALVTAAEAAGQQWRVVVIPGLEQGSWPRAIRDSFAQTERLADILTDAKASGWRGEKPIMPFLPDPQTFAPRISSQIATEKRIDEARMFYSAVGRARGTLRLVAIQNEDALPSVFMSLLEEQELTGPNYTAEGDPIYVEPPNDVDLHTLVGQLRRRALGVDVDTSTQRDAARALGLLSLEGVPLAGPDEWAPGGTLSTSTSEDGSLHLSPARLGVAESCPLRWFFETNAANNAYLDEDPQQYDAMQRGLIVHEIAEEHPFGTNEELQAALREKWVGRGWQLEEGWGRVHFQETSEMLTRLAGYYRTVSPEAKVLLEEQIRFSLGSVNISGRADRIEVTPDGTARVIDIKTGGTVTNADAEDSLQLLAYQLGSTRMGYSSGGAALLFLEKNQAGALREQSPVTSEGAQAAEQRILSIAESLTGPQYEADPETGDCRYCPFRLICPAQAESVRGTE